MYTHFIHTQIDIIPSHSIIWIPSHSIICNHHTHTHFTHTHALSLACAHSLSSCPSFSPSFLAPSLPHRYPCRSICQVWWPLNGYLYFVIFILLSFPLPDFVHTRAYSSVDGWQIMSCQYFFFGRTMFGQDMLWAMGYCCIFLWIFPALVWGRSALSCGFAVRMLFVPLPNRKPSAEGRTEHPRVTSKNCWGGFLAQWSPMSCTLFFETVYFFFTTPCVDANFVIDPLCWRYFHSRSLQLHNSTSWTISMFVSGRLHRQICSLMPDMDMSKETHSYEHSNVLRILYFVAVVWGRSALSCGFAVRMLFVPLPNRKPSAEGRTEHPRVTKNNCWGVFLAQWSPMSCTLFFKTIYFPVRACVGACYHFVCVDARSRRFVRSFLWDGQNLLATYVAESLLKRTWFLVGPCKRDLIIQGDYSSLPSHVLTLRSFSIEKECSVHTWGWIGSLNYLVSVCKRDPAILFYPSLPFYVLTLLSFLISCLDATVSRCHVLTLLSF